MNGNIQGRMVGQAHLNTSIAQLAFFGLKAQLIIETVQKLCGSLCFHSM